METYFSLAAEDGGARAGVLRTGHGDIPTPIFRPVGTQGSVKAVEQRELLELAPRQVVAPRIEEAHAYPRTGREDW